LAGAELSEHESFLQAARLVPQGVLCLLSALNFHELTTQDPFEVWLALPRGAHRPRITEAHSFLFGRVTERMLMTKMCC
jgi:predicted transcriptional regulator of viral defense system